MKMPDIEDVRELASYILMGDREKECFKLQVCEGMEPDDEEAIEKMTEDFMSIDEAIEAFNDEELDAFALVFGTNHPYPTALRVRQALNQVQEQIDLGISKEKAEAAKEAYNRNKE